MELFLDYYRILQVHQSAEQDVIETTYKKLCKKYHPDICSLPEAEARMKEINIAYEVLGDAQKRAKYTAEWLKRNERLNTVPVRNQRVSGTLDAKKAIEQYFFCLAEALYPKAYDLLSDADKKHVTLASFVEWQQSVAEVYAIRRCEPRMSRHYDEFVIDEHLSCVAKRFDIEITEENKLDCKVSRYTFHKFVVNERGAWRIYLGYRDLGYIVDQFRFIANTRDRAGAQRQWQDYRGTTDIVRGLPNRRGFMERSAPEAYRFKRYRRCFAVAVVQIDGPAAITEKLVTQAGHTLKKLLRLVDVLAYIGDNRYAVLLAETQKDTAQRAMERLSKRLAEQMWTFFDAKASVKYALKQYAGEDMDALLASLCRKLPQKSSRGARSS